MLLSFPLQDYRPTRNAAIADSINAEPAASSGRGRGRGDRSPSPTAGDSATDAGTSSPPLSIADVDDLLIDPLKAALSDRNLATTGDINSMRNRLRAFLAGGDGGRSRRGGQRGGRSSTDSTAPASRRRRSASGQPPSRGSTRSSRRSPGDDAPTSAVARTHRPSQPSRADRAARRSRSAGGEEADDASDADDAGVEHVGPFGSKVGIAPFDNLDEPNSRLHHSAKPTHKMYFCCVSECTQRSASGTTNFMCKRHFNRYIANGGRKGDIKVPPKQGSLLLYADRRCLLSGPAPHPLEESDGEDEDEDDVGPSGEDAIDFSYTDSKMTRGRQLEEKLDNYLNNKKKQHTNTCGRLRKGNSSESRIGGEGRRATAEEDLSPDVIQLWTANSTSSPANEMITETYPQGISGIGRGDLDSSSGRVEFSFVHRPVNGSKAWHDRDVKLVPIGFFGEGYLCRVLIGGVPHAMDVVIGVYPTAAKARVADGLFRATLIELLDEGWHALSVINQKVVSALDGKSLFVAHLFEHNYLLKSHLTFNASSLTCTLSVVNARHPQGLRVSRRQQKLARDIAAMKEPTEISGTPVCKQAFHFVPATTLGNEVYYRKETRPILGPLAAFSDPIILDFACLHDHFNAYLSITLPEKGSWKSWQSGDAGIDCYFHDQSGALMIELCEETNRIIVDRMGTSPSNAYIMNESVIIDGLLDELDTIARDEEIATEDRLLVLKEPGDAIDAAREGLAFL